MQFTLPNGSIVSKSDLVVNFWLSTTGSCKIGKVETPRGYLTYFAFRCMKHGIQIDYEHGYNYRLDCPKCLEISLQ